MKILVGSENPVKIDATREAFGLFYPEVLVEGRSVASGVSHQPQDEAETFAGARNRAEAVRLADTGQAPGAQFFVGIEGGLVCLADRWFVFGAMCILDCTGPMSFGSSPHFEVPPHLLPRLRAGEELGMLVDELMGRRNTKQSGGAIGYFTRGAMGRTQFYVAGMLCALVPFLNEGLYFPGRNQQQKGRGL